jgi:hypothetical protein
MSKDLLAEATRALRETAEGSELEARATRARIMSGLHQTRVRRRTRYAYLLPIAATFVAASAWGAANGNAQRVWTSIARATHLSEAPLPGPQKPPPNAVARPLLSSVRGPDLRAPSLALTPVPTPQAVASSAVASSPTPRQSDSLTPTAAAPLTSAEAADPSLALYRVAHTAHFVDHDPARALAAWDAYLAAAPNGSFAPEAHYNRALSLVRLGRNTEARNALEPFANGAYGGYRQADASALLERIGP